MVVGGGLAGCATAIALARAGRQVTLLERARFPRHKLCGEFLSPESQDVLRSLGCLDLLTARAPATIRRARFTVATGDALALRLPGEALGLSRYALDEALFAYAASMGVEARSGVEVRGITAQTDGVRVALDGGEALEAGWVVAAHGRRAKLDHALGRDFMQARHPYVGLKRHHRPAANPAGRALAEALEDHVEIHAFDGGYCGMSFVEGGVVNVCMLLESRRLDGAGAGDWDRVRAALLEANPALAARLAVLEPAEDKTHAVAQIPFVDKPRAADGVLFVGDAAGMIAPLAGDGQGMALTSGAMLAAQLAAAPSRPGDADRVRVARSWDRAWRRRYALRMTLSRRLQSRLLDARRAPRMLKGVRAIPGLADGLARWTRG